MAGSLGDRETRVGAEGLFWARGPEKEETHTVRYSEGAEAG